ncbi:MAG: putative bifunctional diguanylate cyclase/phosphodiesterase [Solirubrobacteraceae bacterium]
MSDARGGPGPGVAESVWKAYLAAGGFLCLLYLFAEPLRGNGPLINLLGLSPVVAIAVGVRLHRPASATPWLLCALGLGLFWLGDLYTYSYPHLIGHEVPFPSLGDGFYLAVYPMLMAGLLMLVRRRSPGRDRGGVIDAAILTVGLALPSWVVLITPYLHDHELSLVGKLVSVAYPLGDVLLLAATVRLALDSGRRQPAFYLLSSSIVLLLVTDFVYGVMTLHGTYDHQLWLDAGWIGFYLLWGAAALHPSMRGLDEPSREREIVLTRFRLALLTLGSLIAPVIGLAHDVTRGDYDMAVVRSASILLFALVVARMAGLVRLQERSLERERVLTRAGGALVAATTREEIDGVAVAAARELAGPDTAVALYGAGADGELTPMVGSGGVASQGPLPADIARALLEATAASELMELPPTIRGHVLPDGGRHACAFDIAPRRAARAVLVLAGPAAPSKALCASLDALATQVALALESAALTEEVHRRRGEARFGSLVRHASDLITVIGADGTITYQSPSIERVLGYAPEAVIGTPFARLVDPGERGRLLQVLAGGGAGGQGQVLECSLIHADGHARQFEILCTDLSDDESVKGIVLNGRDVSERKAFEEQLTHQAFHDPVTGLANRALFGERVRHAIARGRREQQSVAVVFLDLDDFKTINDSLGHSVGDQVLIEVAKRIATSVRTSDTAARFGGDEFALLLEDIADVQEGADTAERLLEAIAVPLRAGHKELSLRCSIGMSIAGADGTADADELIRDADAAMYIAKREGKGSYRVFQPAMHEGVLAHLELRTDLQRAIATDQLVLHYQPVVRLEDATVSGVEALLRWRHPERGLVPPDEFIPLAEDTGLIVPIGRWVLREACRQGSRMMSMLPEGPRPSMSVNLSLKQLQHSDIVGDVRDALADSGLPAELLTLEITETVLMADTDVAAARLQELKELGIRLALDDFGTGYSSLSYLSRFPVDILKMDRSFLRAGAAPEAAGLTTAVVALGATLSLEVVAEGIELSEQWHGLRDLGCQLGQGFYFAHPMDAEAIIEYLGRRASEPAADVAGHAP